MLNIQSGLVTQIQYNWENYMHDIEISANNHVKFEVPRTSGPRSG